MSAFNALRDASLDLQEQLRHESTQLFTARIGESFEDGISKKLGDLSLFTSKLRLLKASLVQNQIPHEDKDESTILANYEDTLSWQIIEEQVAKSVTQSEAVRKLLTTPNSLLDPEMVERKENIMRCLNKYCNEESTLLHIETVLKEKEDEYYEVRDKWDIVVSEIRQIHAADDSDEQLDMTGPLYLKLKEISNKLEMMRWHINKLSAPRTRGYNWLTDPHKRLNAIKMARKHCTVEALLEDTE